MEVMFRNVALRKLHRQNYVEKIKDFYEDEQVRAFRAQRDWKGVKIAVTMTTDGQLYARANKIKQK